MKQEELIHLHGLMAELADDIADRHKADGDIVNRYSDLDVRPTSIHKQKKDHKRAIFALSYDIDDYLEEPDSSAGPRPEHNCDLGNEPSPIIHAQQYPTKVQDTVDELSEEYDEQVVTTVVSGLHNAEKPTDISRSLETGNVKDVERIQYKLEEEGLIEASNQYDWGTTYQVNPFLAAYSRHDDPREYFDGSTGGVAD